MTRRIDRQLVLVALVAVAIVLPRSLMIARAHSPTMDSDEHLDQGLAYLRRQHHPQAYYDPPLGKMLVAFPLWVVGAQPRVFEYAEPTGGVISRRTVLYDQRLSTQALEFLVAGWKALLFVPCVIIAFAWARQLYGTHAGWIAAALLLIDPTIAAHTAAAALDVLAMEATIVACFLAWRFVKEPSSARLVAASLGAAFATQVKHTALILPGAFVLLALTCWFVRPRLAPSRDQNETSPAPSPRRALNLLAGAALLTLLFIWAMTLFDVSRPADTRDLSGVSYSPGLNLRDDLLMPAMKVRWPAGIYIASVVGGFEHVGGGHAGYLWGEHRDHGWRHYFLAVALYKVPIGIGLVLLLGLLSLVWRRPTWDELSILIPALLCAAMIISTGYNVGFRHALPTYGLLLVFASRCLAAPSRVASALAWVGVIGALVHALTFHPDYLSYTNGWSRRPYLAISDSNIDWAQGVKQARRWIDAHPDQTRGRTVWIDFLNHPADPAIKTYLGNRVRHAGDLDRAPTSGLLILSPIRLVGLYHGRDKYKHLRDVEPTDVIGHSLLVYDLDAPKP